MARVDFDPTTYNKSTLEFTLGATYTAQSDGREYRYVQNSTDGALAAGDVCEWASTTTYLVTQATAATSIGDAPAGVAVGAISVGNYGFILVRGIYTAVKGVATITAARLQKASATAGAGTDVANAYDASFGTALTGVSGGRYTVMVNC